MRSSAKALLGILLLQSTWVVDSAAQTPLELGVDAGIQIDGNGLDAEARRWAIPVPNVRAGWHVRDRLSLEASVGVSRTETLYAFDASVTSVELATYGLYHFGTDRGATRFHVLFGLPFRYNRVSDESVPITVSDSEIGLIGGFGATIPLGEPLALRLQTKGIAWRYTSTRLSFLVGLSVLLD